jgi:hypothetical protein
MTKRRRLKLEKKNPNRSFQRLKIRKINKEINKLNKEANRKNNDYCKFYTLSSFLYNQNFICLF